MLVQARFLRDLFFRAYGLQVGRSPYETECTLTRTEDGEFGIEVLESWTRAVSEMYADGEPIYCGILRRYFHVVGVPDGCPLRLGDRILRVNGKVSGGFFRCRIVPPLTLPGEW